jgi:hypothetical protein
MPEFDGPDHPNNTGVEIETTASPVQETASDSNTTQQADPDTQTIPAAGGE